MTYTAQELSQKEGQPVELYQFTIGAEVTRLTNAEQDVTVAAATYTSETIQRSEPRITFGDDAEDIEIVLPRTNALPQRYINIVPAQKIQVTISRIHRTDGANQVAVFWEGVVVSVGFAADGMATMRCRSLLSELSRQMPRRTFQGPCNHILYDQFCKLSRASFQSNLTVASISGRDYTITGLSAAGGADATYFEGGYVSFNDQEYRLIMQQTGDVAKLLLPFDSSVQAGSAVKVFAGCDHSLETCHTKFSNAINYGGFPFVPSRNPFNTDIDR